MDLSHAILKLLFYNYENYISTSSKIIGIEHKCDFTKKLATCGTYKNYGYL